MKLLTRFAELTDSMATLLGPADLAGPGLALAHEESEWASFFELRTTLEVWRRGRDSNPR